ncbi:MAG: electron transfer flavoprotein subunit alpha/FixB family protein [Defluviitaleaceae bacterium]|nr:electron transfer flavoprotein subunit alpha/FixB family protein [Defluviitaleaceae bacterium]
MSNWDGVMILAETRGDSIHPVSYELLGKGRELADQLGCRLDCLMLCENTHASAELNYYGADTVYAMCSESFKHPEEGLYKSNIVPFIQERKPGIVLVGATNFGRSLAPRVAAALHTGLTADCTALSVGADGRLVQIRPAFSDNILAHITTNSYPQMATVRHGEFSAPPRDPSRKANVIEVPLIALQYAQSAIIGSTVRQARDIAEADVIVACGRGVKSPEDIAIAQRLAELLGGQVGFSRALVDAGMADASCQVGYSGVRVRPRLYIACGISGAPQHLAGMKESGTIIAVNHDASAPIFGVCDIGYTGDLYDILPRLIKELEAGL